MLECGKAIADHFNKYSLNSLTDLAEHSLSQFTSRMISHTVQSHSNGFCRTKKFHLSRPNSIKANTVNISRCQWRGTCSDYFDVLTGTKQGGVISPRIFSLYVDDLIARLRKRGIGCHIIELFIACLFYADDLCLIAPTRSAMQELINCCQEYCAECCLSFNIKKSKI